MKGRLATAALLSLLIASPVLAYAQTIHHEMKIILKPEKHLIVVTDEITLPETLIPSEQRLHFLLHGGLSPGSSTAGVKIHREKSRPKPEHFGIKSGSLVLDERIPLEHYTVTLPAEMRRFVLKYQGEIDHPIEQEGEEDARNFSETPGILSSDGVFLAGTSYWYPWFNEDLLSFELEVTLPQGWDAVSQGERTLHLREGGPVQVRWVSPEPQEEIYLVAGPWTEYSRATGAVQLMAFLRKSDEELANRYLETAAQYLEIYQKLIGPYPYKKFALVENFWETGYGMPSFTLLGPRIIRFPFILHSSYPHEILHNWWGNGVYVDDENGNWSEGLTTYLADHLVQEQRGTAAEYRRNTLQKYTDYVATSKDFPLTEFRSRRSSLTEAVGYGKTLMFFHMLRQRLGDDAFTRALQRFYQENRFRRASFLDLKRAFEGVTGENLTAEFEQWIERTGAPVLRVSQAKSSTAEGGFRLTARIEQTQLGPPYRLQIPIAVHLESPERIYQTTVKMEGRDLDFSLSLPARPLRLLVDPQFDLFRRLDRNEIPPALSLAFGAERVLIVLPSAATDPVQKGYRELAKSWQGSRSGSIKIKWDREVAELPSDAAVWLFGWENRFFPKVMETVAGYDVSLANTGIRLEGKEFRRDRHSVVLIVRSPVNPNLALAWVAVENGAALPGLGRKLPHYGQYSYLVFEGDEPVNVAKGQWPVANSPLSVTVTQSDDSNPLTKSRR